MTDTASFERKLQRSFGDDDDTSVLEELRKAPDARHVLEELARSPDLEVRGWVPGAAQQILGAAGEPLIRSLTKDPDPDIRGLAVDALETLDPRLLESLVPSLRERLKSTDNYEVISSAWKLAQLGDADAAGQIEQFRTRFDPSWWQYKAASVILVALRAPKEIPERIRSHDHEHMPWLSYAAILLNIPNGRGAVEDCVTNAPDDDCRRTCADSIEKGREHRS